VAIHGLGQNFLQDAHYLGEMLKASELSAADLVVEIGPGAGILTKLLCRHAGFVVAVEVDRSLAHKLPTRIGGPGNLLVVPADVLRTDLTSLVARGKAEWSERSGPSASAESARAKLVANLPFYLTAPFFQKLEDTAGLFSRIAVMVQLEVAERLLAAPADPNYGALTVMMQYQFEIRWLGRIPARAFKPQPKVDAATISLLPRPKPIVDAGSYENLRFVVQSTFMQRRKTLREALGRALALRVDAGRNTGRFQAETLLKEAGIETSRRGETLSLEEFALLARLLPPAPDLGHAAARP